MSQDDNIRWGTGSRAEPDDARAQLIAAACYCYQRLGIAQTSVGDIAAQAKVSRTTMYRYFSSRSDILRAVIAWHVNCYWDYIFDVLPTELDLPVFLAEAFAMLLDDSDSDAGKKYLMDPEVQPLLDDYLVADPQYRLDLVKRSRERWPMWAGHDFEKSGHSLSTLWELFNRLLVSFVRSPSRTIADVQSFRAIFRCACEASKSTQDSH